MWQKQGAKDEVCTECGEKEKARYTMKSNEEISPHSLSRDLSHAMKSLEKTLS